MKNWKIHQPHSSKETKASALSRHKGNKWQWNANQT